MSQNDSFPGRRALKLSSKEYIALGPIHLLVPAMLRLWGKKVLIRPVAVVLVGMGIDRFYSAFTNVFRVCRATMAGVAGGLAVGSADFFGSQLPEKFVCMTRSTQSFPGVSSRKK